MKNYEEMSDFEINKAVAIIAGVTFNDDGEPVRFVECDTGDYADFNEIEFDPCNNPSDAWHIIVDNKISLTCHHSRGEWSAVFNAENICFHANNPLRAAMIVFLKMNEDKL